MVENSIRSFAVGRRNWLSAEPPGRAQGSAPRYSVIETVKANEIESFAFLVHLFTEITKV